MSHSNVSMMLICTCAQMISCLDPSPTGKIKAERIQGANEAAKLTWVNPEGQFDKVTIVWSESPGIDFTSQEETTNIGGLTPGETYTFTAHVYSGNKVSLTNTTSNSLTLGNIIITLHHQFQNMPSTIPSVIYYWNCSN